MGKLVLILGGARSGKSAMAESLAREAGVRVGFVATAEPRDEEMRRRIEAHRLARPAGWRTIEEPLEIESAVREAARGNEVVLVDCLTLWLSNHLCLLPEPESGEAWAREVEQLTHRLEGAASGIVNLARTEEITLIVVSNEVGLGLVPSTPLGRAYRDVLGALNRRLALDADRVLLMVAGLPLDVKRLARGA